MTEQLKRVGQKPHPSVIKGGTKNSTTVNTTTAGQPKRVHTQAPTRTQQVAKKGIGSGAKAVKAVSTAGKSVKVKVSDKEKREALSINAGILDKFSNTKLFRIIDCILYWKDAYLARLHAEGKGSQKEYATLRKALLQENSIITTMRTKFQEESDKLIHNKARSVTIQLTPEYYRYFSQIKDAPENQIFLFEEVEPLVFKISLNDSLGEML